MKNFIIRTISGVTFAFIMIGGILWGVLPYGIIMSLTVAGIIYEFTTISMGKGYHLHKTIAIGGGVAIFVLSLLVSTGILEQSFLLLSTLPFAALFILNLYVSKFNSHNFQEIEGSSVRKNNGYELYPFAITSMIYGAVPFSLCNIVVVTASSGGYTYNGTLFLSMIILLWATDVGAYLIGSTLGQRFGAKLFPSISPKKSWVGFFGGMGCAVAASIILQKLNILEINMVSAVVLAIIICIFGVWGDLSESQLKRNFGVKDSGTIMPGHGGVLDRFDGALLAFPIAVIYLHFFVFN